jgi:hypothetical protein
MLSWVPGSAVQHWKQATLEEASGLRQGGHGCAQGHAARLCNKANRPKEQTEALSFYRGYFLEPNFPKLQKNFEHREMRQKPYSTK